MSGHKRSFGCIAAAFASAVCCASVLTGCGGTKPTPDIMPHYISSPELDPVRPIDSRDTAALSDITGELTDEQYRSRIDELYTTVVIDGKKPLFTTDDPVKPVYDAAIALLDSLILNSWHESDDGAYKTVHTLHDYLACEIKYDFVLYDDYCNGAEIGDDPAFDIDGVLLNKLAVCDGLSKAMCFLCAIEGVDCERMVGAYGGTAHAWNKVNIGGSRYNIDITADSANYVVNDGAFQKQLSHGFFMLSDETLRTFRPHLHEYELPDNVALADFDYYADKTVSIGGKDYPMRVRDAAALNGIFSAIADAKRTVGKIELKLDFPEKTNVNDGDMYASEIAEAYSKIKNSDFKVTSTNKPYFQYPNGVYLFLIYR